MVYCRNCGKQNNQGNYCKYCGNRLEKNNLNHFFIFSLILAGLIFLFLIINPTNRYNQVIDDTKNFINISNNINSPNENIVKMNRSNHINHINDINVASSDDNNQIDEPYCGDGVCQKQEENICYKDCSWCGDGYCDLDENCTSCTKDCGNCSNKGRFCGDSICTPDECNIGCIKDCATSQCIDGICQEKLGENCLTSPTDCRCNNNEYCSLQGKCIGNYCGDGVCQERENCSCQDCSCDALKRCYDGVCKNFCGNGICEQDENKTSCPFDCGTDKYVNPSSDPDKDYPIIFVHGHSMYEDYVSTFSLNAFKDIQTKLDSDGLYKDMGTILPNSNISEYNYDEWSRFGKLSVRTTYYIGNLDSNGYYLSNDENQRPIKDYAERLSKVVDIVKHHTGKNKVIIVAHSMGGLVARYYIKNLGGSAKVSKLIMIATPNHGVYSEDADFFTLCSWVHPGQECVDMGSGSNFLTNLNNPDKAYGETSYYNIMGSCDGSWDQVVRVSSARLDGATNTIINSSCYDYPDTLHSNLLLPQKEPEAYNYLKQYLNDMI